MRRTGHRKHTIGGVGLVVLSAAAVYAGQDKGFAAVFPTYATALVSLVLGLFTANVATKWSPPARGYVEPSSSPRSSP